MGLFGALTTAVTGMRAQSYALENISGNIANSRTTAFKRIDTSFEDLIPDSNPNQQLAGNVVASSRATNTVQGDIQTASISTFMAINGNGYFVVEKPGSFSDNRPTFSGVDLYSRRGDFQLDQNGYLVNGAGYYLSGIPVDAKTGNLVGSVPKTLQFQNGFLPAQATSEIDYRANLASYPLTANHDKAVPGSELLNPADFSANPINGAATAAKVTGSGATISADAAAVLTGTNVISSLTSAGGTLSINGSPITITAGANANAIKTAINLLTGTTGVTAALDTTNHLTLTSADAKSKVIVDNASTLSLLTELGIAVGTTNPTNILTQSKAADPSTMTIQVGANAALNLTFGVGNIETLGDLNTALAGLVGGIATADPLSGNIDVTATSATDTITVGGNATPANFGIRTLTAVPANGTVKAQDVTSFLNETVGGGAVTVYDVSGSAVNVQMRWAKIDSSSLGIGHTDNWNLFYQNDSTATGTAAAWTNAGVNYAFLPNGQLSPAINSTTLSNVTVNGVALGDIRLVHSSGGMTQFADANGVAQVNLLQQNGFSAGQLQSVAVNSKGRIEGTYSNGRTIDLAEISLANFSGANLLQRLDGGAFAATAESGPPTYNAAGKIVGSSLEGSNTDIADEFTKLIVTQQAYSANTRVITTSNQMVQDLLTMLR